MRFVVALLVLLVAVAGCKQDLIGGRKSLHEVRQEQLTQRQEALDKR